MTVAPLGPGSWVATACAGDGRHKRFVASAPGEEDLPPLVAQDVEGWLLESAEVAAIGLDRQ